MIFLLLLICDLRPSLYESRTVDRVVYNSVYTMNEGKKVVFMRQFVTYRKTWGGWRCTGYLVVNEDTQWERRRLPNGYTELLFYSISGKPRRVVTKDWTTAETTQDIEVLDRQLGPRFNILFGSYLGNMKDD